jgi:hypothetical protein
MNPSNEDEILAGVEKTVFSKLDSEEASESSTIIDNPPDGGLTAWLQVVASWMIFFNTWYVASIMLICHTVNHVPHY